MKKDPERDHKQWTFSCICQKYDWFQCFEATYSKDTCQFILKRTSEQKDNQRHLNKHTLPKTNSSPLKIGHPKKEIYIFQVSIFRCKLAVSFRVPGIQDPCWFPHQKNRCFHCRRVDPGLNLGRVGPVDPAPEVSFFWGAGEACAK